MSEENRRYPVSGIFDGLINGNLLVYTRARAGKPSRLGLDYGISGLFIANSTRSTRHGECILLRESWRNRRAPVPSAAFSATFQTRVNRRNAMRFAHLATKIAVKHQKRDLSVFFYPSNSDNVSCFLVFVLRGVKVRVK